MKNIENIYAVCAISTLTGGDGVGGDSCETVSPTPGEPYLINKMYSSVPDRVSANVLYNLGKMAEEGNVVGKNKTKATNYYRKSAKLGHAGAQYKLGEAYEKGVGVFKSETHAVKWYLKSAMQGNEDAQRKMGFTHKNPHSGHTPFTSPLLASFRIIW